MSAADYRGSCLCGDVRWSASQKPENLLICHCRSCALAAGAPGVPWATWKLAELRWKGAEPRVYASSQHVVRSFCGRCGTALSYVDAHRPGEIDVAITTLRDPDQIVPEGHIWMEDAAAWEAHAHELPSWPRGEGQQET